jgi:hypothetical protein
MRASPFRLIAYLDPWLRAATSPGRAEKLGAACGGDGDDDHDDTEPGTSSQLDQAMRRRMAKHAGVPLRRVRALRALGDSSPHPQGRPCGRPPPAAVLAPADRGPQAARSVSARPVPGLSLDAARRGTFE